jgi:hypothetical protein
MFRPRPRSDELDTNVVVVSRWKELNAIVQGGKGRESLDMPSCVPSYGIIVSTSIYVNMNMSS